VDDVADYMARSKFDKAVGGHGLAIDLGHHL